MKAIKTMPGRIVAFALSGDNEGLFAIYEQPRQWWQFWRPDYGVCRFQGEEIT